MKKVLIFSAMFLLASVSLSAQVVKGAGLWYFNGLPNVTPSVATGTEIAYSINNKALYKWNRTTSAWVAVVQDSSITNELQDLILSGDTLSLTLSDSVVLMAQYRNHVWEITALSDTTSITGDIEGDIAYTSTGDTIAFRGATAWLPFTGGGGGGTFNSFNIAGDTGSDIVTDGQTVTIAGGYGINTAETGGTVTVTADTTQLATQSDISGFGTMSSFTVAGGSGTPQTITNGNTLIMSEGYGINTLAAATDNVRTEVDTTQIATQNDISGLPSGTGTNQRIVVWTGTNSQGNSTQLQSAAGVTLDANLAYRITGGTTASRPTGAAGMMYWNTSNVWWDFHNGTAWFNPIRSATATGLGTSTHVGYFDANGLLSGSSNMTYNATTGKLLILGTSGDSYLEVRNPSGAIAYYGATDLTTGTGYDNGIIVGYNGGGIIYNRENTAMTFATNNTIRMRIAASGEVGIGTTAPDRLLHAELSDAVTNAMVFPLRLTHTTSGTAAAGSGAGMEFEAESAGGTNRVAGTIENPYTTATNAAEVSDLVFRTMRAGTLTESLRSLGNGTLQIGTLSGTATQLMGATAGNIATAVTLGAGLSFSSGTLNGAFLPLTLTGATEVNTAGQNLYFRDAAGYPFTFMNSNYWLAASGVNNYIDVGSTASNVKIISDGLIELNSSVNTSLITTGRLLIDGDSTVIDATLPVNTNATHVLVRDVSTRRLEEKAISSFGNGIISALPAGDVDIITDNILTLENTGGEQISLAGDAIQVGSTVNVRITEDAVAFTGSGGFAFSSTAPLSISTIGNYDIQMGAGTGTIEQVAGVVELNTDSLILNGDYPLGDTGDSVLVVTPVTNLVKKIAAGAGITFAGGGLATTQCFGYNSESFISLTAVTATPDTVFAADDLSPCNFAFDADTGSYTYSGATRHFKISVSGDVIGEGNGEYASFSVYQNGTAGITAQCVLGIDPVNFTGQGVLYLTSGDVINVRVLTTAPGGEDFDIFNYSLIITEI